VDPASHEITFQAEAEDAVMPVRVWFHLRDFGADPAFAPTDGAVHTARIPRPPVDRLEYLFVVRGPDGGHAMVPDPRNPHRIRSVFGDKSVVELPGYAPPWWVAGSGPDPARGHTMRSVPGEGIGSVSSVPVAAHHDDRARRAGDHPAPTPSALVAEAGPPDVVDPEADLRVSGQLRVPEGSTADEPLPLLVVHDGPEYADLAELLRYVSVIAQVEPALRCRVLLLQPVERDRSYSASPAYARALVTEMLPQVTESVATTRAPVGVGSSLGGLAMLHAATTYPGTFGGVFSQSGSFFAPATDQMERGYRFYERIVRFVDEVTADPDRLAGLRVTMTCGTGEENLANNRALARRLGQVGVATELVENRDGHNHVGWRDCLDPGLRDLLRAVWDRAGNN
jgi:enterochelin esterase family protein